jgi:hypothetical protein
MRRSIVIAAIAIGAVAIAGATATATTLLLKPSATVATLPAVDTAGFPSGGANPGIFTDTCKRTTTAPNDPILMPGMTGSSMQHDFFGNLHPSATITPATITGGATNCSTTADASSYWTPVLYQNGKALEPSSTLIYWRAPAAIASETHAMPAGITMIAGNEAAETPQDARVIGWTCSGTRNGKLASEPHDCATGFLRLVATFPNCWDGHTLDGHSQKNVAYATSTGCPPAYPVQIPQVVVHVSYPTQSAANLTLSVGPTKQGSILTGHADFMDGWNQPAMAADTAACVTTQTRCGPVSGPVATPKGGTVRG